MVTTFFRKAIILCGVLLASVPITSAMAHDWHEDHRHNSHRIFILNHTEPRHFERSFDDDILSKHHIARLLYQHGYTQIRDIYLRFETYDIVAIRSNGAVIKLQVSAMNGDIFSQNRIDWVRARPVTSYHRPVSFYKHNEKELIIEFNWSSGRK
jgi:hypothetical protein